MTEAAAFGGVHEEGSVRSADGTNLFWQSWTPARPRAALLFIHGLGEHSGRYRNPVEFFVARGYACFAIDLRGHGRSAGPRGHVRGFGEYLADVDALRSVAAGKADPVVLIGHSQGGLVALLYALGRPRGLGGVVVSSPLLGLHPTLRPSPGLDLLLRVLGAIVPRLSQPTKLDAAGLSRDPAVVEAYRRDPLVTSQATVGWYVSLRQALREVHDRAPQLEVPTLLLTAGHDLLVDGEASVAWAHKAPPSLLEIVAFPDLYHEIFNEPERQRPLATMEHWLDRRLGSEGRHARVPGL